MEAQDDHAPSTFRVGRIADIPIGIHRLRLVNVPVITWGLGSTFFPDAGPGLSDPADWGKRCLPGHDSPPPPSGKTRRQIGVPPDGNPAEGDHR